MTPVPLGVPPYPYPSGAEDHDAWCSAALKAGVLEVALHDALTVRLFADRLFHTRPDLRLALLNHASAVITQAAENLGMFGGAVTLGMEVGLNAKDSERLFSDLLRDHWDGGSP